MTSRRRALVRAWTLMLAALCLLPLAAPAHAKTLWVVLLPGTSLSDWQRADAPHLHQLLATGSIGLMNTRTARTASDHVRETPESAALTLGAGSRAAAGPEAANFAAQISPSPVPGVIVGQLYARRMGFAAPGDSWVNVNWPAVLRENANQGYDLHPGNLADGLERRGVAIEAVGGPLAFVAAANGAGAVMPYTGSTPPNACILWDAGSDLHAADAVLGRVMMSLGNGRLIVLSPCASDADYSRGARLCPVAVWGEDVPKGLLYSASTRRPGLVTDTDFATEVSSYFGVPITSFPARPFGEAQAWQYRPTPHALSALAALNAGALSQWGGMRALPYLAIFLGAWMLTASLITRRRLLSNWAASVPPAVVLAALLSVSPISLAFWLMAAAIIAFFVRPTLLALLVGGILLADMLLGDPLMRAGLLGYSAIEGARYYGMGNEAMGALIGSALVLAFWGWRKLMPKHHALVWLGLAFVAILLGSPFAGAKAGGLIVALAAFGAAGWLRSGRPWNWRIAAAAAGAIALALIGFALLDAHFGGSHASHLGQAAARLSAGGVGEWGDIIRRKLAVEGHLLWHSAWAVSLWGGLAAMFMVRKPSRDDAALFRAGLVAVIVCLAVNDAGVVAASLCIVMLWSRLAQERNKEARRLQTQTTG